MTYTIRRYISIPQLFKKYAQAMNKDDIYVPFYKLFFNGVQAMCLPLGASVSLLIMFFFFDSMQVQNKAFTRYT